METILLMFMISLTVLAIIIVCKMLRKPRELYLCKDIACKYGVRYCCYSCGQRKECEAVCDYKGSCEWRVKA